MSAVCGKTVRGGHGVGCQLDLGHKGYHSITVYTCDGCGKRRRGQPAAYQQEPEGYSLGYCFPCVKAGR